MFDNGGKVRVLVARRSLKPGEDANRPRHKRLGVSLAIRGFEQIRQVAEANRDIGVVEAVRFLVDG